MASEVDLVNRALSKLGATRITSLTDATTAARAVNHAYPFVRDAVLRAHPWNCTVARVQLAPLSTAPPFGYDYQYQSPSDCIKVLEVTTDYDWVVEGTAILTDEGTVLDVRYQKQVTDVNEFDSLLFEAIAARLAFEICEEVTQSNTKKVAAERDFEKIMRSAKMQDAQEQSSSTLKEDSWVEARN